MKTLTQDMAQKIIDEYCQGSSTYELADRYDRWQTSICNLISGRSWKQCKRPDNIEELIKSRHEKGHFKKGCKDYVHNNYPELTPSQNEIIIGSLLGDGSLTKICPNRPNSCFSKKQCVKYKEYLYWHEKELSPFNKDVKEIFSKDELVFDNSSKKIIHTNGEMKLKGFYLRSPHHPVFTNIRKQWYPNNIKIIPTDLKLTPLTIAIWFCDDGCNQFNNREALFCTNSFTLDEADFLCQLLKQFDVTARVTIKISAKTGKEQPLIKCNSTSYDNLIHLIKPYVIWDCMSHKIKWRPAMKPWEISGKFTENDVLKIFELIKNHKQHEIASMFGVHKNTISSLLRGDSWKHLQHLNPYIPKSIRSRNKGEK